MDTHQTHKEQDRQLYLLLANSSLQEQRLIIQAREDRSLRLAVEQLGAPNGNR